MLEHVPHADEEVLNDEVVIIHPSGSVGEPEVFEPYTRIHFPSVFGDVGGWSEALWERRSLDATTKGGSVGTARRQEEPTSQQVGAWETPASQSESYRLSPS